MRGPSIDVAVVGGGPGGSAAATLLAQQGWRVVLLEREQFPRPHVGESLLPASLPILRDLGVLEAVAAAGFVRKLGATMVWGADPDPWSWYFRETNRSYPHSYQVERDRFDQLLLENAAAAGVDVRQGERVSSVEFLGGGVRLQAESSPVAARFVVDASGQAGLLARQLRLRQNDAFFRTWRSTRTSTAPRTCRPRTKATSSSSRTARAGSGRSPSRAGAPAWGRSSIMRRVAPPSRIWGRKHFCGRRLIRRHARRRCSRRRA